MRSVLFIAFMFLATLSYSQTKDTARVAKNNTFLPPSENKKAPTKTTIQSPTKPTQSDTLIKEAIKETMAEMRRKGYFI